MNDDYFRKIDPDIIGQIKLPSFITFNSSSSQLSLGDCITDNFFTYRDINQYQQDNNNKTDEEDSGIQCSLASNSSISTPEISQSFQLNKINNNIYQQSIYQNEKSRLNVGFATPNSFFYKDADKPSKAVTVTHLPNHNYSVIYVEKGRTIEVTAEANFNIPSNTFLQFDIYTLKGNNEEPVYGDINGYQTSPNPNLCFIQAVEENKISAFYVKTANNFISMIVPFKHSPSIFSVVFPFLNFKCSTSSKKIVLLRISAFNGSSILASTKFQLVCCTSPNRDMKRHFEKFNSKSSKSKIPSKREKLITDEKSLHCESGVNGQTMNNKIKGNPQYVIMTESYEIWKILNIVHQQLMEHFDTNKNDDKNNNFRDH